VPGSESDPNEAQENKTMTDSVSNPDAIDRQDAAMPRAEGEEGVSGPEQDEGFGAPPQGDGAAVVEEGLADVAAETLQKDFNDLNDRHLRLAAEFNNYRRRVEQERAGIWGRAQSDIVARFLDVLDDLQRVAALDLGNATVETIMEGIDLVDRKFVRMLSDAGAEVLDPVGERFDPELMEAMMRVPAETEDQDETVAQVFQKGYTLKGQLVRPARVSVMKLG
jgi:molecular chaperone GrpE